MRFGPSVEVGSEALEGLILNSLESKRWFIEIDEFDRNERLLLNFGHTFGHAMEGASHYAIAHGIGVGLGIECAMAMQERAGVSYHGAPQVARLREHLRAMIGADATVRSTLPTLDLTDVLDRIGSDKKHGKDFYTFILIAPDGRVERTQLPRAAETLDRARTAVQQVIESYA